MILDFEAKALGGDGNVASFSLQILEPRYEEGRGYFCEIVCPFLTDRNYFIFGVDEAQARELSFVFIRQRLVDEKIQLYDEYGHLTEITVPVAE